MKLRFSDRHLVTKISNYQRRTIYIICADDFYNVDVCSVMTSFMTKHIQGGRHFFQSQVPGMVGAQFKRVAVADAKGLPMYQPISNMASYQQTMAAIQLQQPQYIPVSCE